MNTKIKLSIALAIGMYFFTSCNNDKTTTNTEKMDITKMTDMNHDTTDKKMDMDGMNMNIGLMGSMNTMMDKMSSMKMSGDFDIDFANMMMEHHQGAIDMSEEEVKSGTDEKIKGMAQNIISAQKEEIATLQAFVKKYKPSGMKHGEGELEKSMSGMMNAMKSMQMSGNMDKDFVTMMAAHHEGAIAMAKKELEHGMDAKLKQMAQKIINDQTKEITEFKNWSKSKK